MRLSTEMRLIQYLSEHCKNGWSIKKYDHFIVTCNEDDFTVTWKDGNVMNSCDNNAEEGYKRCHRKTRMALDILDILSWDVDIVKFARE